jgi:catechol-2,3-dioxygenase
MAQTTASATPVTLASGHRVNGKLISPGKIAHWGIRTTPEKLEQMIEWHCNFFGGEVVHRLPNVAFIRFDDEHHRIVIIASPAFNAVPDKKGACGVYHVAFSLDTLEDLATSYEQRKAYGIVPHWPVNHGMSTSMYYLDPDENEFEMQVDNFATAEEAHDFMRTEEFGLNPIGVDFDPEEFVRRVRSGEPEGEIKRRPVIGKRHARWENSIYFNGSHK